MDFLQDIRYGMRMLRKNPGSSAIAILILALGIGANTAIFSVMDAVLLKFLPVPDPERLVVLATNDPRRPDLQTRFSYPMFEDLKERAGVFSGMFVYNRSNLTMSEGGRSDRITGELVSSSYFSDLGIQAIAGRTFSSTSEPDAVAVLSYNFWKRRFGGELASIGSTIHINGYPFTVIGVTPAGFYGTDVGSSPDVRLPITMMSRLLMQANLLTNRDAFWLPIMARLKPGTSIEQAQAATDIVFWQIQAERTPYQDRKAVSIHIQLLPGNQGFSKFRNEFSRPLVALMAIVGLLLVVACSNVGNLLLARATARQAEIAVRLAVGARRSHLIRQLLTESFLLSFIGAGIGLILAFRDTKLLLLILRDRSVNIDVEPDLRVLGFTFCISLLAALLLGLAPATQLIRHGLTPSLKIGPAPVLGDSRRYGISNVLVIAQIATSLLLVITAGLFVRTLDNLKQTDSGFRGDNVLMLSMDPRLAGHSAAQTNNFYAELVPRIEALPDVESVSLAMNGFLAGSREDIYPERYRAQVGEDVFSISDAASPKFFQTMGIPIAAGRDFGPQDNQSAPRVAIVNDVYARYFFGKESPIGKRIGIAGRPEMQIIGVVKGAKYRSLRERPSRAVYRAFGQVPGFGTRTLYVRTTANPTRLIAPIRAQIQILGKDVPVFDLKTFREQLNESLVQERLTSTLASFFGVLALLMASIGLYGLMAYGVARRTREIGIRMALGAQQQHVLWIVLRQALILTLIGMIVGIPAVFATNRFVSTLLFGLKATDPATIALATLVLMVVATLAAYLPARRASKVDPMVALRYE